MNLEMPVEKNKEQMMTDLAWDMENVLNRISKLTQERSQLWNNRTNQPLGQRYEEVKKEIEQYWESVHNVRQEMDQLESDNQ